MVNPDLFALLCHEDMKFKPPKLTCISAMEQSLSSKVRVVLILESLIINYTSSKRTQASTKSLCDFSWLHRNTWGCEHTWQWHRQLLTASQPRNGATGGYPLGACLDKGNTIGTQRCLELNEDDCTSFFRVTVETAYNWFKNVNYVFQASAVFKVV